MVLWSLLVHFTFGKTFAQPHTCITVIQTLLHKEQAWIEFESQNLCLIDVWGCVEILPNILVQISGFCIGKEKVVLASG